MNVVELSPFRRRFSLTQSPFLQRLLPAEGEEWAQAQPCCGDWVIAFMVHDPIRGRDRPFRTRAITQP